jgi:TonB-linked SusC/RagA family outer membrane protein
MKQLLRSLFILLFVAFNASAQNRTVTGTVTSKDDGMPIPGVSVKVKGTNIGVSTSASGKFTLSVPQAAVLEFSSIGFLSQEISVQGKSTINVSLGGGANELSEIIVVAYGTVKKESFTGAASIVGSKEVENRTNTSFLKSLQGAAPGVQVTSASGQPGSSTQIRIRGEGSISAGSAPLYVIDGVAVTPTGLDLTSVAQTADVLSSLNPNDIESITVLKDASAAAIYGSRAANGVVLVTTKQGKTGTTKFNANVSTGYSSQAVKKHDVLNAQEYFKVYFDSYYANQIAGGATPAVAAAAANNSAMLRITQPGSAPGQRVNNPFNTLTPFGADGQLAPGTVLLYDTDWRSEVLRSGITKDVNVSASGGTPKLKHYISGGYFDQEGIVIGSDFRRFSGKFNLTNDINDFFTIGINNTLANSRQNTPAGEGGGANPVRFADLSSNIYSVYERDINGNILYDATGKAIYSYVNPVATDMNPLGLAELDQYITNTTRITANPFAQVKFLNGFTAKAMVSLDYSAIRESQFYNSQHGNGRSVGGRGYRYAKEDITTTYINTINYDKSFGVHSLNILAGQEAYKNKFDVIETMATKYGFPGQSELYSASVPGTASSYFTEARFNSYFSRVNYDFNNKYYFSGSFRRDGYSAFGQDNKYGNFYSVGGAWRISRESFFSDNVKFVNELKLRASYGVSGNNSGIGRYQAQGLYGLGNSYEGASGMTYTQLANNQLQWEKIVNTEVGLEFMMFNRRLTSEISYFNKASNGLLFAKPLSRTTGFSSLVTNLAEMDNKGIEVVLSGSPVLNKDFRWDASVNLTSVANKVTKLTQNEVVDGSKMLRVGENRFQWYLREYAGVDPVDGRAMWYMDDANGNKVTTKAYASAKQYTGLGSAMPKFYGGFSNALSYKDFDFSIYTSFSVGGKIFDELYQSLMHNGISPGQQMAKDVLNAWTPANNNSSIPRFVPAANTDLSNSTSSRFLFDGSYLRIKNISLGYTLKNEWTRSAKLSNVRVFVTGENLLTFAKHKGFDPETTISGSRNNDIPNVKTFSAGLTLGF